MGTDGVGGVGVAEVEASKPPSAVTDVTHKGFDFSVARYVAD